VKIVIVLQNANVVVAIAKKSINLSSL